MYKSLNVFSSSPKYIVRNPNLLADLKENRNKQIDIYYPQRQVVLSILIIGIELFLKRHPCHKRNFPEFSES